MAEIYDIHSGTRFTPQKSEISVRDLRKCAKMNDRVRKKFDPVDDILPSLGVMQLEQDVLFQIVRTLRKSRYEEIKFTHICDGIMSRPERIKAEKKHAGGLFGVGSPLVKVVWNIRTDIGKIKLSLADEFFRSRRY